MQIDKPLTSSVPQQLPKLETQPETFPIPEPPPMPKSLANRQAKFNENLQGRTGINPLSTTENLADIDQQITESSSNQMLEENKHAPVPEQLEVALQGVMLKTTETQDKTFVATQHEFTHDQELLQTSYVPVREVQRMYNPEVIKELYTPEFTTVSTAFTAALVRGARNTDLAERFKETFRDALHQLDKADSGLNAKQKIATVIKQTQKQAADFIGNLDANSDMAMLLKFQTQLERKALVSQMLGELKGYDSKAMGKLSEKKQQFIAAILSGIEEGLPKQQAEKTKGEIALSLEKVKNTLQNELSQVNPASELVKMLSVSSSERLREVFTQQLGTKKPAFLDAMLTGVLEGLPNQASTEMVPTPGKPDLSVPAVIPLNGIQYQPTKYLGVGGFADVIEYTNPNDLTDKIAIKQLKMEKDLPEKDRLKLRDDAVEEVLAHMEVQGPEGHANIIGLKGVVNGPKGQIYIAQELASGGDLGDVRTKLDLATQHNLIPVEARQLLATKMIQETLQGMQYLQAERQGHHFDLKIYNLMLGNDNQVKLIDFGLAGTGRHKRFKAGTGVADNPVYKAPEQLVMNKDTVKTTINEYMKKHYGLFEPTPPKGRGARAPKAPIKPENTQDVKAMADYRSSKERYEGDLIIRQQYLADYKQYEKDFAHFKVNLDEYKRIFKELDKQGIGNYQMSQKADTWDLGLVAYELLYGKPETHPIWGEDFMSKVENNLIAFKSNPNNRIISDKPYLTPMDKLINGLMHPHPAQRTTFDSALESSAFFDEQLDKPELKALQVLVNSIPLPPKAPREETEETLAQHQEALRVYGEQLKAYQTDLNPLLKALNLV